jgi:hypothetical protein
MGSYGGVTDHKLGDKLPFAFLFDTILTEKSFSLKGI